MKKFLLFFVIIRCFYCGYGQCETQNFIFNTQSEIDNFSVNFPNCTTVGNINITRNISNLNGLNQLTSVTGNVYFQTFNDGIYALTDISGLYNLTSIGGTLGIKNIPNINAGNLFPNLITIVGGLMIEEKLPDTITGFNNLTSVGNLIVRNTDLQTISAFTNLATADRFEISSNEYLSTINGFGNLTDLSGGLIFFSNINLTALPNFQNLTSISAGGMVINDNNTLIDLHGLDHLETINGFVGFNTNTALSSLTGLNQLTSILGDFQLSQTFITNLDALNNVTTLPYLISILSNSALNDIGGLSNVASIPNSIYISGNPLLSECAITPVCHKLASGTSGFYIDVNNLNCNTLQEISDACALSVAENIAGNLFDVYPNPVSSALHINNDHVLTISKITITDVLGRANLNVDVSNGAVDVSALAKGMYMLTISTENGNYSTKFIKE